MSKFLSDEWMKRNGFDVEPLHDDSKYEELKHAADVQDIKQFGGKTK